MGDLAGERARQKSVVERLLSGAGPIDTALAAKAGAAAGAGTGERKKGKGITQKSKQNRK